MAVARRRGRVRVLYDFETLISKKGVKRKHTIPIEVAFLIPASKLWFESKLWPLEAYGNDCRVLLSRLSDCDVRQDASVSAIRKIGGLSDAEQEKTMEDVEGDILRFLPESCEMVAHNGKSFDDHILKHWFPRVAERCTFTDSLCELKKMVDLDTYSLPIVARRHRRRIAGYMREEGMPRLCQHRALYDVVALHVVLDYYGADCGSLSDVMEKVHIRKERYDKWEDVDGIGKVTGRRLRKRWASPRDFEMEMSDRPNEVRGRLRKLGVTRYKAVLGLLI